MFLNKVFSAFVVAGSVLLAGQATSGVGVQAAPASLQDSTDRPIERALEPVHIAKGLAVPIQLYGLSTFPDGGLRTSVEDLSRFFIALLSGKLGVAVKGVAANQASRGS